jgi:biotin transport system substrate-specific component
MAHNKTKNLVLVAMCASIICLLAQITIPLPLIPITGQTLAIGIVATILGSRHSMITVLVYLTLGLIGLPVFSQFTSGFGILFGPTGGYLIGFIPTAFLIGLWLEKTSYTYRQAFMANLIGMCITLALGSIWLKLFTALSWKEALVTGVYPFLPVGIIKAFLAAWFGIAVRQRLNSAKLLPTQTKRYSSL